MSSPERTEPEAGMPALRVLVADDHTMLREGLRRSLEAAGLAVVAEAGDGEEAVRLAGEPPVEPVVEVFEVGDRVTHDQFGLGTVISVTGQPGDEKATIDFGDERPKQLLLRYAPVEKL